MINLAWDSAFKRSYKKRISRDAILKEEFWDALELFARNPFHSYLKTHQLTGTLQGLWAFSVAPDCRVIFKFYNSNKSVLLIDIGTHEEVY
jgi:addiction module RelE/StbE family toxin